jgi:hypothetical protein
VFIKSLNQRKKEEEEKKKISRKNKRNDLEADK